MINTLNRVLHYIKYFRFSSAMLAISLYLVAIAFAYPIQCYPAIQIILDIIRIKGESLSTAVLGTIEHVVRPIFVLTSCKLLITLALYSEIIIATHCPCYSFVTVLICYMVPIQGAFVAFVGNLCTALVALVFPALMELCLLYPNNYGKYRFYLVKDLIILGFGLSCTIFGVAFCAYLIYVRILCMNSPNDESI